MDERGERRAGSTKQTIPLGKGAAGIVLTLLLPEILIVISVVRLSEAPFPAFAATPSDDAMCKALVWPSSPLDHPLSPILNGYRCEISEFISKNRWFHRPARHRWKEARCVQCCEPGNLHVTDPSFRGGRRRGRREES